MSEWKEITCYEDIPEDGKEYLFYDKDKDYHVLRTQDAKDHFVCGFDEFGDEVLSDEPYYVSFGLTHFINLPKSPL